jgi:hypothetical protein
MVCRRVHLFVLGLELLKVMAKDYPNARAALSVAWLDMCIILNFELQDNQCMRFGLSRLDSILQRNSCKLSYPLRRHMSRTCSPCMCTCLPRQRISPCNIYRTYLCLLQAAVLLPCIFYTSQSPLRQHMSRTCSPNICTCLPRQRISPCNIYRTYLCLLPAAVLLSCIFYTSQSPLRRHMSRTCSPCICTCLPRQRISPCNIYCNLFCLQDSVLLLSCIFYTSQSPLRRHMSRTCSPNICTCLPRQRISPCNIYCNLICLQEAAVLLSCIFYTSQSPLRQHMSRTCSPCICTCLSHPRISPCNIYCNLICLQEAAVLLYRIVCTLCSPFQQRNVRTYISCMCKGLWWDLRILLDISRMSFYLHLLETLLPRIHCTVSALHLGRLFHMGTYRMSIDPF